MLGVRRTENWAADMSSQDENELRVFRSFASVCPMRIDPDSIRKVSPPAPDIACKLRSGGSRAFELVEVLDKDMARMDNDALTLASALTEEYERVSGSKVKAEPDALADALVWWWRTAIQPGCATNAPGSPRL